MMSSPRRRTTVLESFLASDKSSNPYVHLLMSSLPSRFHAVHFSWRRALLGRYDVFHVHWPEHLVRASSPTSSVLKTALACVLVLRLALVRTPVVRTLHNVEPHEAAGRVTTAVLRRLDALTTTWVRLNDHTPVPDGAPSVLVPHGHYRDWFEPLPEVTPEGGRVLTFGRIRGYKGVLDLVRTVALLEPDTVELHVVGQPDTPRTARDLEEAAVGGSVRLDLRRVEDAVLAREVLSSELVVLPYRAMHNSGALLLSLSLGRPVLAPRTPVNESLVDEVGSAWLLLYDGALDGDLLVASLERARRALGTAPPDLAERDWERSGRKLGHALDLALGPGR